jgi:hypothetical protein
MQETQEKWKQDGMTPPKVNSSTIMDSNDSEVDETTKNFKKWLEQL